MSQQLIVDDEAGAGRVYLVRAECQPPLYKIGVAGDVESRVRALQTGCPWPLTTVATLPGTRSLESRVHARFEHRRVRGEWFELDDADVAWFRTVRPVARDHLACLWVREIPVNPRRAAVVAGLLLDTFDLGADDARALVGAWLGDPGHGARAVATALDRSRRPLATADEGQRDRLRAWMAAGREADGDWLFAVGDAREALGLPPGKRSELRVRELLKAAGAESVGRVRHRGRQRRWWRPPAPEETADPGQNNAGGQEHGR